VNSPPKFIYLQFYDELGEPIHDVTWCVDQIEKNDLLYVLVDDKLVDTLAYAITMAGLSSKRDAFEPIEILEKMWLEMKTINEKNKLSKTRI